MALYVTYAEFMEIYGASISEADFNRLGFQAQRFLDTVTTGVDGIRKLSIAFPTDEYAAECVKQCLCKLIDASAIIEQIQDASGFITRADGTVTGKTVTSMSSGSESISFSSGSADSAVVVAASSPAKKTEYLSSIVRDFLSGIQDKNGVNLLYGGMYPYRLDGAGNVC